MGRHSTTIPAVLRLAHRAEGQRQFRTQAARPPAGRATQGRVLSEKDRLRNAVRFPSPDEDMVTGYPDELRSLRWGRSPTARAEVRLIWPTTLLITYGAYWSWPEGARIHLRPYLRSFGPACHRDRPRISRTIGRAMGPGEITDFTHPLLSLSSATGCLGNRRTADRPLPDRRVSSSSPTCPTVVWTLSKKEKADASLRARFIDAIPVTKPSAASSRCLNRWGAGLRQARPSS